MIDSSSFWLMVILLSIATAGIRLSFLVLSRKPPSERMRRILRFVPVTVLPALIAPLAIFPKAAGGAFDPVRLIAVVVALGVGAVTRNILATIVVGMAVLWGLESVM